MSVRYLLTAVAAALLGGVWLAAPAAAHVLVADGGSGSGRAGSIAALAAALISVVIGGWALRSAGRVGSGNERGGSIAALVVGLVGIALGGLALAGSDGGVGSGNGRGGAIVALGVGLVGVVIGALALARSRRTA